MDQPERVAVSGVDGAENLDRRLAREAGLFAVALLGIVVVVLYVLR